MKSLLRLGNCIISGLVLIALAGLSLAACATAATPAQTTVVVQTTPSSTPSPPPTPTPLPTVKPTDTPVMPTPPPTLVTTATLDPIAGFDISNLILRVRLRGPERFTATLQLEVENKGDVPSPEMTFYLFEGDPQTGGELITRQDIPGLNGYDGSNLSEVLFSTTVPWNVKGKAGDNELFSYLCPASTIPAPDVCRTHHWTKHLREISYGIDVNGERERIELWRREGKFFDRGDVASISVYVANLTLTETLAFTMITQVYSGEEIITMGQEKVMLLPGELIERVYTYDTTDGWGARIGADVYMSGKGGVGDSIYLPEDAYFIAEPLTGAAPLTVTFMDRSAPFTWVESWQWDFGDGMSSTLQFPTHTYMLPGAYTVSLTTTVPSKKLNRFQADMRRGIAPVSVFSETTVFTITRPNYINVFLPEETP